RKTASGTRRSVLSTDGEPPSIGSINTLRDFRKRGLNAEDHDFPDVRRKDGRGRPFLYRYVSGFRDRRKHARPRRQNNERGLSLGGPGVHGVRRRPVLYVL